MKVGQEFLRVELRLSSLGLSGFSLCLRERLRKSRGWGRGRQTKGTFFVWVVTFIGKQNRGFIGKGARSSYW